MANFLEEIAGGEDTLLGFSSPYIKNDTLYNDSLGYGTSGDAVNFSSLNTLFDSKEGRDWLTANPEKGNSLYENSGTAADGYANLDKGGNPFGLGGDGEGEILGMDPGSFLLGAINTGLGFMNYGDTKEFNDTKIDAMKQNMALTADQYKDYKDFKTETKARWS